MNGDDLKRERLALGVTQRQLALALGIHPNTVACWERGDKPIGNPTMVRLALVQVHAVHRPPGSSHP